jgi:hypothetical protein
VNAIGSYCYPRPTVSVAWRCVFQKRDDFIVIDLFVFYQSASMVDQFVHYAEVGHRETDSNA